MSFGNDDEMHEIQLFCAALISSLQVEQAGHEELTGPHVARWVNKRCRLLNVCLPSSSSGKPRSVGGSERVQLSGVFNVRKGKLALPVNRWSKRQVTLCGTCLIVSSVKHAHTGKMHILPLIGGKVLARSLARSLLKRALGGFLGSDLDGLAGSVQTRFLYVVQRCLVETPALYRAEFNRWLVISNIQAADRWSLHGEQLKTAANARLPLSIRTFIEVCIQIHIYTLNHTHAGIFMYS